MTSNEKSVYVDEEMVDPFNGESRDFLVKAEHLERYKFAARVIEASGLISPVVYDVACGNGYGSEVLAGAGAHVFGFDRHESFLNQARQRTRAPARFINVNLEDTATLPADLPPAAFIVSFETLEHLENPREVLQWMYRTLKKDGQLICSIPNAAFEPKTEEGKPKSKFHKGLYSKADAENMIQGGGFKVDKLLGQPLPNIIVNHARFLCGPIDAMAFRSQRLFNILSSATARPTSKLIKHSYSHIFIARKN